MFVEHWMTDDRAKCLLDVGIVQVADHVGRTTEIAWVALQPQSDGDVLQVSGCKAVTEPVLEQDVDAPA